MEQWLKEQIEILTNSTISVDAEFFSKNDNLLFFQNQDYKLGLIPGEYIDLEVEKKKLSKKLNDLTKTLKISKSRLENEKFIQNAKQELIEQEKKNFDNVTLEIKTINETLKTLNG